MNHRIMLGVLLTVALSIAGCETSTPTEPQATELTSQTMVLSSSQQAASKSTITGVIDLVAFNNDDTVCWVTPGGVEQCRGGYAESYFTGDIEGTVIWRYRRQTVGLIDSAEAFMHITTGGQMEGEVTWNSRTGMIGGAWTGECKIPRYFCKGTLVAHGSGDLEGVKFQIKWQGLWPFDYEGFALDPHGG